MYVRVVGAVRARVVGVSRSLSFSLSLPSSPSSLPFPSPLLSSLSPLYFASSPIFSLSFARSDCALHFHALAPFNSLSYSSLAANSLLLLCLFVTSQRERERMVSCEGTGISVLARPRAQQSTPSVSQDLCLGGWSLHTEPVFPSLLQAMPRARAGHTHGWPGSAQHSTRRTRRALECSGSRRQASR